MFSFLNSTKYTHVCLLSFFSFLFLMTSISIGCNKNGTTDIAAELIKGSWKWTAVELVKTDGSRAPNGPETCELDNTYSFSANGTWTQDVGAVLCDNGGTNTSLPYEYNKSSGELTIGDMHFESVKVNGNRLQYSEPITYVGEYRELVFIYERK